MFTVPITECSLPNNLYVNIQFLGERLNSSSEQIIDIF